MQVYKSSMPRSHTCECAKHAMHAAHTRYGEWRSGNQTCRKNANARESSKVDGKTSNAKVATLKALRQTKRRRFECVNSQLALRAQYGVFTAVPSCARCNINTPRTRKAAAGKLDKVEE